MQTHADKLAISAAGEDARAPLSADGHESASM